MSVAASKHKSKGNVFVLYLGSLATWCHSSVCYNYSLLSSVLIEHSHRHWLAGKALRLDQSSVFEAISLADHHKCINQMYDCSRRAPKPADRLPRDFHRKKLPGRGKPIGKSLTRTRHCCRRFELYITISFKLLLSVPLEFWSLFIWKVWRELPRKTIILSRFHNYFVHGFEPGHAPFLLVLFTLVGARDIQKFTFRCNLWNAWAHAERQLTIVRAEKTWIWLNQV